MARPIVIAAGGTGGHFFPAEALAAALIRRGERIVLMTDARRAAVPSEVFAGRESFVIRGAGLAGRGLLRAARGAMGLAGGTVQARTILADLNAAAVVGFGGYPAVAPVLAARSLRARPAIVLHEQNAVAGRANRLLARLADRFATSFADTVGAPRDAVLIGNPVRPAIAALAGRTYAPPGAGAIRVLVLGGSLGARVFSDIVPDALARHPHRDRIVVTQQCRAEDLDRVRAAYAASGITAELATFFGDVADRLAAAHLVIARAGASTVAELAVAGCPAVLVPLPGAIDDHQSANARALTDAVVMPQSGFTPDTLATALTQLDDARLALMAARAAAVGRSEAAERLADLVQSLVPVEARS